MHDGSTLGAEMYIDGELVPVSIQEKPEELDPLDGFAVGRSSTFFGGVLSGGKRFDGSVDEVKVWNRRLSEPEIRASYGKGVQRLNSEFQVQLEPGSNYVITTTTTSGAQVSRSGVAE